MKEFKSRLEYLKTNSTSKECKDICATFEGLMESYSTNLTEETLTSMLLEKLETIKVKDSVLVEFISKAKKIQSLKESDNLGVLKTIENIRKSKISNDPTLKYVLESFETEIKKGTPEYLLIEGYINRVTPYSFDSVVKESVTTLTALRNKLSLDLLIKESTYYIKNGDKNNFFTEVIAKLDSFLMEGNRNIAGLAQDLKRWSFNPTVNSLVHKLSLMESESAFSVPANNGNCDVTKIYSPVLFNHKGGDVFVVEGNVFKTTKSGLQKLSAEEIKSLPTKFVSLCEAFFYPGVQMEGENVIFYKGKNKVTLEVSESGNALKFNGKSFDIKNIGNQLYYSGAFNNGDLKEIQVLTTIAEGLDTIFDIDWAKTITSRVYEGAKAIVFKHNDKIFINKINPSMNENVLLKANGTQASNIIKSFLKYDISESLSDLLVGEQAKISSLEGERKVILESINKLEKELSKIEDAILANPKIEESKEIVEMKNFISNEINSLKSKWSLTEAEINKLNSVVEAGSFEVGDKVKVVADGKTGNVESINDSDNKINVIMEDGKVVGFIPEAIEKNEEELEDNTEANEEEGEDFKEEGEEDNKEVETGDEEHEEEEHEGEEGNADEEGEEHEEHEEGGEPEGEELGAEISVEGPEGEVEISGEPGEEEIEMETEPEVGEIEPEIPGKLAGPSSAEAPVQMITVEPTTADSAADPKMADVLTDPIHPTQGEGGEETVYTFNDEPEAIAPVAPEAPVAELPIRSEDPNPANAPIEEEPVGEIGEEEGEEEIKEYTDEHPIATKDAVAGEEVEEDEDYEAEIGDTKEEGGEESSSDNIEFDDDAESTDSEEEGSSEEGEEEPVTLETLADKIDALTAKIEELEAGKDGESEEEGEESEGEPSEEESSEEPTGEEGESSEEEPTVENVNEKGKPSAGLSKKEKSSVVKKAKKGADIGKKGKNFKKVAAKAAKKTGSKESGKKIAAAAMWKNIAKGKK
jgi:hypothetical protein